jgi:RimJ/RimL family protein N-acetyltransferase
MTTIEPLAPDQFPLAAGWLSDPAINRWLTSEWRGRQVDTKILAIAVRNQKNRLYLVRDNGTPVGLVGLSDIDRDDRCAMVWYLLGERASGGKGLATAAVGLACRAATAELSLSCIYAWIMEPNTASRRVLEKNGFREAGRLRRATTVDGRPVDRIYFDLTAPA